MKLNKIKIYALPMCSFEHIDDDGYMIVEEGGTLRDVYKMIKLPMPLRYMGLCRVNYEKPKLSQVINDGDIISFLYPVSGG